MIGRFDDPATENDYLTSEREARLPATRLLLFLAAVTLVSYIGFNPFYFPSDGVVAYNVAATFFIAVLLAYFGASYTGIYLTLPVLDIVFFIGIAIGMFVLVEALSNQHAITQFTRPGLLAINFGLVIAFSSILFVASLRYFVWWAIGLAVAYVGVVLTDPMPVAAKFYSIASFTTFFAFACFVNWDIDRRARQTFAATLALEAERAKTEEMLYNVLPEEVAQRLRRGEVVADSFADVSVVFVDIVGFSQLARKLSPGHLVKMLNTIFGLADKCAQRRQVEKVKTIGDAYLAVAGGTTSTENDAVAAIRFAQDLIKEVAAYAESTQIDVAVRVGINTGPVVGGVIGQQRMAYDYWGDTMNTAARLEGAAHPGGIAVSESTYFAACSEVEFKGPEVVPLKGIGDTTIYRVNDIY